MLAVKNTVLIIRLDCPLGIQQYWALIPPEAKTGTGTGRKQGEGRREADVYSAYQPSPISHGSSSIAAAAAATGEGIGGGGGGGGGASSVSASFQYSSWSRGGLNAEATSAERGSVQHMVRSRGAHTLFSR